MLRISLLRPCRPPRNSLRCRCRPSSLPPRNAHRTFRATLRCRPGTLARPSSPTPSAHPLGHDSAPPPAPVVEKFFNKIQKKNLIYKEKYVSLYDNC